MKIERISDIYEVLKGYTHKKRLVVALSLIHISEPTRRSV